MADHISAFISWVPDLTKIAEADDQFDHVKAHIAQTLPRLGTNLLTIGSSFKLFGHYVEDYDYDASLDGYSAEEYEYEGDDLGTNGRDEDEDQDVQCILAKLCARGKIELRQDSTLLDEAQLERAISNTHGHGNILLTPQVEYSAAQIRGLHDFYAEFFDGPPYANEAKTLGQETAVAFRELHQTLTTLRQQAAQYPFLTALDDPIQKVQALVGQPYTFYLTELRPQEDALLELKEGVIDPVRRFMSGTQKAIYDDIRTFLQNHSANFSYVGGDEARQLRDLLDDPHCYQGNKIQQGKTVLDNLKGMVTDRVQQDKAETAAKVDERWQQLAGMAEFAKLTEAQQAQLEQKVIQLRQRIENAALIDVMHGVVRQMDDTLYHALLRQMDAWANPPEPGEPVVIRETVTLRSLYVPFTRPWLADEADVAHYLQALEKALLAEIEKGKQIQV